MDEMDDDVFEANNVDNFRNPSPTGYRGYKPPDEVLRLCQTNAIDESEQIIHKTILLGDSGVGKTSLLVKFDTGKFHSGSFSATVGIGFTAVWHCTFSAMINEETFERRVVQVKPHLLEDAADSDEYAIIDCGAPDSYIDDSFATRRASLKREESEQYDVVQKIMLLGDSGVGKTCLLVRFRDDLFLCGNFITTVGIDFRNKVVAVDETRVKLQIWDTAGQERFRSVTHAYYRDAHALLLLYDVTNKTSYDNIRAWLGEIREYAQDDVVIMLIGNKADAGVERAVRRQEGERLAKEYNVAFMETSAKSGQNVELAFLAVARELTFRQTGRKDASRFSVQDYIEEQTENGGGKGGERGRAHQQCPPCHVN